MTEPYDAYAASAAYAPPNAQPVRPALAPDRATTPLATNH